MMTEFLARRELIRKELVQLKIQAEHIYNMAFELCLIKDGTLNARKVAIYHTNFEQGVLWLEAALNEECADQKEIHECG